MARRGRQAIGVLVVAVLAIALAAPADASSGGVTRRVSVTGFGQQVGGEYGSFGAPSVSADGRYVAFATDADGIAPGDKGALDVFVRDRVTRTTIWASVSTPGVPFAHSGYQPSISADGRFVAFTSYSILVPGDTNNNSDVFVRDLRTRTTTRVSLSSSGAQGNGGSLQPSISADGRYVAFASEASNLVPRDGNGVGDIFVRDRLLATTRRVSVSSVGAQADDVSFIPTISGNGQEVAFSSYATNLVPVRTGRCFNYTCLNVYIHNTATGRTLRVSANRAGVQANSSSINGALSPDGRYVAFQSSGSNLVPGDTNGAADQFVRDLRTGTVTRITISSSGRQANGESVGPAAFTANDREVVFESDASNLVPGDTNGVTDIFVRDRVAGTTRRVSLSSTGAQGNARSIGPTIAADGSLVAFNSDATNLVPNDTNHCTDTFVRLLGG